VDNPDLRFGMELCDLTDIVKGSGFKVFADVASKGGIIKGINAKKCATFSRKEIDDVPRVWPTSRSKTVNGIHPSPSSSPRKRSPP